MDMNGKETVKSIKNKEPLHQTGFKAMQGYFAKKTGGLKRGLAGVGQYLTQAIRVNNRFMKTYTQFITELNKFELAESR